MVNFNNLTLRDEIIWFYDQWNTEAVAREVRATADMVIPNSRDRWRYELPILRAVYQIKRLPIKGILSAETISALFKLSVPRAEFVSSLVWG